MKKSEELLKKKRELETIQSDIARERKKIRDNIENFFRVHQEEKELLERVLELSKGTTAESASLRQLEEQQYQSQAAHQQFEELEEVVDQQEKEIRQAMEVNDEAYVMSIREEEENAKD